jgi:hypothetical protein
VVSFIHVHQLRINLNHKVFIDGITKLNSLERDEAYKTKALIHIKSQPRKYLSNWIANIGRLLFSTHTTTQISTSNISDACTHVCKIEKM